MFVFPSWMRRADMNYCCTQCRICNTKIRFFFNVPIEFDCVLVNLLFSFVPQIKIIWIWERERENAKNREMESRTEKSWKSELEKERGDVLFGQKGKRQSERKWWREVEVKLGLTLVSYLTEHSASFTPGLCLLCPVWVCVCVCLWLQKETWRSKEILKTSMKEGGEGGKGGRTSDRLRKWMTEKKIEGRKEKLTEVRLRKGKQKQRTQELKKPVSTSAKLQIMFSHVCEGSFSTCTLQICTFKKKYYFYIILLNYYWCINIQTAC